MNEGEESKCGVHFQDIAECTVRFAMHPSSGFQGNGRQCDGHLEVPSSPHPTFFPQAA